MSEMRNGTTGRYRKVKERQTDKGNKEKITPVHDAVAAGYVCVKCSSQTPLYAQAKANTFSKSSQMQSQPLPPPHPSSCMGPLSLDSQAFVSCKMKYRKTNGQLLSMSMEPMIECQRGL